MQSVVLATGNKKKVNELADRLRALNINVLPQSEFHVESVPETGTTFVENAIIKARHAARVTGLPSIADDSGIEVDALFGQPGVYSSRYAGEAASDQQNIDKMLEAMQGIPTQQRSARFRCVLVCMRYAQDPTPLICGGTWEGSILTNARGENGFGYDPIFLPEGLNLSAAELDKELKLDLSHRGQALQDLSLRLARFLDPLK